MRRRQPERLLQIAVCQHLARRGVPGLLYLHCPNEGYRAKTYAYALKRMGTRAGVSDLLLFHQGKFFALELKAEGERGLMTDAQAAFQMQFNDAGGYAFCAIGLDKALRTLEAWGLIRPDRGLV